MLLEIKVGVFPPFISYCCHYLFLSTRNDSQKKIEVKLYTYAVDRLFDHLKLVQFLKLDRLLKSSRWNCFFYKSIEIKAIKLLRSYILHFSPK